MKAFAILYCLDFAAKFAALLLLVVLISPTSSNLLTSLDRRLTIWPVVVFPMAELLRHRACIETRIISEAAHITTNLQICRMT